MIVNHYKRFLKIRELVTFKYDKICSTSGIYMSEVGVKVNRKTLKKNIKKLETENVEKKVTETCFGQCTSKDVSSRKKGQAVDVASTEIKDKETEAIMKEEVSQKGLESSNNEKDIVLDDFLIRNIMSFPLHVTVDESETKNEITSKIKNFPSVTNILQETMPFETRKRLELWKQKMMEIMGPEKFISHQNDPVKKLKTKKLSLKHKKSKKLVVATMNRGTRLHSALKNYLLGEEMESIPIHKEVEGCWKSVQTVLSDISDVKVVEADIFHPHLHYKGIVDCVASYKNTPHVIEWKQSEKVKKDLSSTFDAPVQLTAYMGALPWCKKVELTAAVTRGLVVVAYCDGAPADVFQMDSGFCQSYWEQWLRRLQHYWAIRSHTLQAPAC